MHFRSLLLDKANEIGDILSGLITGEITVGEALDRIFKMVCDTLDNIARAIWDWFKTTALGKWITEHWKDLLATLLKIFLGWELLKIAGSLLFNGLFGKLLSTSAATSLFKNLGSVLSPIFTNLGELLGGTLLGSIMDALLGVGGLAIIKKTGDTATKNSLDKKTYNKMLVGNGGKEEDQKSIFWDTFGGYLGGAAGGALTGGVIGGPIGAVIGALLGGTYNAIKTALVEVTASIDDMNEALQTTSYYEGAIKGIQTAIDPLQEQVDLMNQTFDIHVDNVYKLGQQYGIDKENIDKYVEAIKNGKFNTDMLADADVRLKDSLINLANEHDNITTKTEKLAQMQKKLAKAQTDMQILNDMSAGNFELAAVRIEHALANETYDTEEAASKMSQVMLEAGEDIRTSIYDSISDPELKAKLQGIATITDQELNKIIEKYDSFKKSERDAYLQKLDPEIQKTIRQRAKTVEQEVKKHPILRLLDWGNDGKIFGISYIGNVGNVPHAATGTNYVASDGLAYIHQGEAIIPKKYNPALDSNNNSNLESAINTLTLQVAQISAQVNEGIAVHGQFVQRGADLVATVEKATNKLSNNVLNNKVYAR